MAAPTEIRGIGANIGKKALLYKNHDGIAATATGDAIPVAGAKKITVELVELATVLNRSGVLTITASVDNGVNFRAFAMLIDQVANTNAQTLTRVASKTRAAAGVDLLAVDIEKFGFTHIKSVVTITDGATPSGTFNVNVLVQY